MSEPRIQDLLGRASRLAAERNKLWTRIHEVHDELAELCKEARELNCVLPMTEQNPRPGVTSDRRLSATH